MARKTGTSPGRFFQPVKNRNVVRHVVYLEEDISMKLALFCASEYKTYSDVVEEALRATLPRVRSR